MRYGGATDFGTLSKEAPAATCLLVSDGRSTFGTTAPPHLPCRLFAIGGKGANVTVLQQMADNGGGRVISGTTEAADWLRPSVSGVRADGLDIAFMSLPAPAGSQGDAPDGPPGNTPDDDPASKTAHLAAGSGPDASGKAQQP